MIKTDVIFVVQGFEQMNPDGGLIDITTLEVYAKTEKEAIKKAQGYIKKKFFRVSQVIEKKPDVSA